MTASDAGMTPTEEAKLNIDGQWFYRGNVSPMWTACASRADGSMSGISEKVPGWAWPILERVAEMERELSALTAAEEGTEAKRHHVLLHDAHSFHTEVVLATDYDLLRARLAEVKAENERLNSLEAATHKSLGDALAALGHYKPLALAAERERDEARAEKDEAYRQRNHLVAALARLFPSGIRRTNIPGWSDDWHGCCFIDLPSGQISYHYHDGHAHLFADLPSYETPWDGHEKEGVHARLAALARLTVPEDVERFARHTVIRCDEQHKEHHPDCLRTECAMARFIAALPSPAPSGQDSVIQNDRRYRLLRDDESDFAVMRPRVSGHIAYNGAGLDQLIDASLGRLRPRMRRGYLRVLSARGQRALRYLPRQGRLVSLLHVRAGNRGQPMTDNSMLCRVCGLDYSEHVADAVGRTEFRRVVEMCARVADAIGDAAWSDYKTGKERGNPHFQGISDGAHQVGRTIRALTESDLGLSAAAGWQVVPVEPTEEMIRAAQQEMVKRALMMTRTEAVGLYQAMLEAAPDQQKAAEVSLTGRWIPVTERLPEEYASVLCYFHGGISQEVGYYAGKETWKNSFSLEEWDSPPSHWQPLPAPPVSALDGGAER